MYPPRNLHNAATPTMVPSPAWKRWPHFVRNHQVNVGADHFEGMFTVENTEDNGHVVVSLKKPLSASERGTLLLDLEGYLKANVDSGITVWLAPLGDRNSLRHLRGMVMK